MYRRLLGILVAVASFACIAFRVVEPRLCLLAGAMIMFLLAGSPSLWFRKFVETMGNTDFLKVILPVFAFTSVAQATGCTEAFVNVLAAPLARWGSFLVPVAVLAAFLTNMALVSATASGLAVGGVFLQLLMAAGIHPALAAASVLAGTWGAVLSPGSKHAALIAQAANQSQGENEGAAKVEAMDVVRGHARVVAPVLFTVMILMWLEAALLPGGRTPTTGQVAQSSGGVAWLRAFVPVVPLVLLWVLPWVRGAKAARWLQSDLLVFQTMLLGIVLAVVVGTHIAPAAESTTRAPAARDTTGVNGTLSSSPALPNASSPEARDAASGGAPAGTPTAPPRKAAGDTLADAIFSRRGMAYAYAEVMTMIISAMVFVAGLETLGLLAWFLSLLKRRRRSVAWYAYFGDMGFAAISGSGDAASCSFNLSVTPAARELGERPRELGSMAWLGAEMGRCFSPVAAVTLAITGKALALANGGLAGISPVDVVLLTVAPIVLAGFVGVLLRRFIKG